MKEPLLEALNSLNVSLVLLENLIVNGNVSTNEISYQFRSIKNDIEDLKKLVK